MNREQILLSLTQSGMDAARIEVLPEAVKMTRAMEAGLACADAEIPMIPCYLRTDGHVADGAQAIVIDAGGTNFRTALVRFDGQGASVSRLVKKKMPGVEKPASWDELIGFVADALEPLLPEAEDIGFCFSYSAEITPEIDGRVIRIDKEVVIRGAEGKLVGQSLKEELARRGYPNKRVVVLNDTAAVLLGGLATGEKCAYSGLIGQVSGTGTNTCCVLPLRRIGKLGCDDDDRVLVNLESGLYDGLPRGDFDCRLDDNSNNPGKKHLEKLTAGGYLGELARLILEHMAAQGLLSATAWEDVCALGRFDAAKLDAWACGEGYPNRASEEDRLVLETVAQQLFERSARAMCVNLLAILLLTGEGETEEKPVLICAEGSLVQKGRYYRPVLERLLAEGAQALGRHLRYQVGEETTLPGSAAAVLLNR